MSLFEFERDVIDVLFRRDVGAALDRIAGDERARRRWRVYRRMARTRLTDAITASFPRLAGLVDLAPSIEDWLDAAPPKSPYLRDVAREFLEHLERRAAALVSAPRWALDLARHEWAVRDVEHAHEEEGASEVREVRELAFERPAVLTPAHRIARLEWSVHRIARDATREQADEACEPGRFTLLYYRDAASQEACVLELSPVAAACIEEIAPGELPIVAAVQRAAEREGFAIDPTFVEGFAALVADLVERGVWLGSR